MGRAHRATGNPRGRPPSVPFDIGQRILKSLERRLDPETGLVRPDWKGLARELGVSRSTIARRIVDLRQSGAVESGYIKVNPKRQLQNLWTRRPRRVHEALGFCNWLLSK